MGDDFATLAEYKTAMLEYLEKFTELTILGIQKKTGRTMPQDQKLALRNKATIAESETITAEATAVAEEPKKRRRRRRKRNKATIAESETIAAKATSAKATAVAEEPKKRRRRRRKRRRKRKTSQTVTAELTF